MREHDVTVTGSPADSDAPFQIEFAPGVILLSAEVRDRASLKVFMQTMEALGALLPETLETPKAPAQAPQVMLSPQEASPMIDVTATTLSPASAAGTDASTVG